jgi:hypothetical protein
MYGAVIAESYVDVRGYISTPSQDSPCSWQLEQLAVTFAWISPFVGKGDINPVPGTVLVALLGINPVGADLWQASHGAAVAMCVLGPNPLDEGIATMLLIPKKLSEVPLGLWQLAQPLLMPAWLKPELLNLSPSCTGLAGILVPDPT